MSFNLKLGNDFLCVLRLPADGKGFIVWKESLELSVWAHGLYGHLDGTMMKPKKPPAHAKPDKSPVSASEGLEATTAATKKSASKELSAEQVSLIEKYLKDLNQYSQEQAIIYQQIALTIPDPYYNFSYFALLTFHYF